MKTKYLFILLFVIIGVSCTDNNENVNPILKKWELEKVTRGMAEPISYNKDMVYWTFNENKLIVENNITTLGPEQINSGFNSGTYTYKVKQEKGLDFLYVNGKKEGEIRLGNNKLTIDYGKASDGSTKIFKRP